MHAALDIDIPNYASAIVTTYEVVDLFFLAFVAPSEYARAPFQEIAKPLPKLALPALGATPVPPRQQCFIARVVPGRASIPSQRRPLRPIRRQSRARGGLWNNLRACVTASVRRRPLHVVDNQKLAGTFGRFQLQA